MPDGHLAHPATHRPPPTAAHRSPATTPRTSFKVMETEHCIAILDAFPVCPGHTLLIPKKASVTCADMEGDSLTGTMAELPKLVRAVQKATGAPVGSVTVVVRWSA